MVNLRFVVFGSVTVTVLSAPFSCGELHESVTPQVAMAMKLVNIQNFELFKNREVQRSDSEAYTYPVELVGALQDTWGIEMLGIDGGNSSPASWTVWRTTDNTQEKFVQQLLKGESDKESLRNMWNRLDFSKGGLPIGTTIIVFRGTQESGTNDIQTDMKIWPLGGYHRGFVQSLQSNWNEGLKSVLERAQTERAWEGKSQEVSMPVLVVGESLGGAKGMLLLRAAQLINSDPTNTSNDELVKGLIESTTTRLSGQSAEPAPATDRHLDRPVARPLALLQRSGSRSFSIQARPAFAVPPSARGVFFGVPPIYSAEGRSSPLHPFPGQSGCVSNVVSYVNGLDLVPALGDDRRMSYAKGVFQAVTGVRLYHPQFEDCDANSNFQRIHLGRREAMEELKLVRKLARLAQVISPELAGIVVRIPTLRNAFNHHMYWKYADQLGIPIPE